MHIYKLCSYDDEWLPLFNCEIKQFRQIINEIDKMELNYLYLIEVTNG